MGVGFKDTRHLHSVIDDLGVRFVGDQVDHPLERPPPLRQECRQGGDAVLVIHLSGGIVRGVDQDSLRLVRDGLADRIEIEGEILPGRDDPCHAAGIVHIEAILDEKGRRNDHLFAGIEERLENHIERPPCAAGHHDLVGRECDLLCRTHRRRNGRPRFRITGIRHVHVLAGYFRSDELLEPFTKILRGVEIGISQTEIEDIFRSVTLFETDSLLEHFPDE